jgi:nucleotidyltransferase AbiEii toxin of type IV toxin-antitoxin system
VNSLAGVLEAAAELQTFCTAQGWRSCVIGGLAVQRWGTPRFTQDADLTLLTGYGGEEAFVDLLLKSFSPRHADSREFALQNRVLLARSKNGVDLDIAMGALPFEERTMTRCSQWETGTGVSLLTCSAEDLLVHKVFAGRNRDWGDVETILARQNGKLDLPLVRKELGPLLDLKGEQGALDKLEGLIKTVNGRMDSQA